MDHKGYIEAIETQGGRIADATDRAGLDAAVPSCPGWTTLDLVRHVSAVCEPWYALTSGAIGDISDFVAPAAPPDADAVARLRDDVSQVAAVLAPLDPATPSWTWSDSQTTGFVERRLAHELTVHAWDATLAAGETCSVPALLASDGVDEYLEIFAPHQVGRAAGEPLTGHLHATDVEGEWFVRTGSDEWAVERTHAKGDVAIRGTAQDLLLLMWGRSSVDGGAFEIFGEPAQVADLLTRLTPG